MRINFADGPIECSDEFSCKDFTGAPLVDVNDGAYVYGSCFSQETPDSKIFRASMRNVTFRNCNLSNVYIPDGNILIDCQTDRYEVQNDLNDWIVDNNGYPVTPLDHTFFTKSGLPMPLPQDIPATRVENPVDLIAAAKDKAGL